MQTISFLLFRLLAFVVKNHLKREKNSKKNHFSLYHHPSPGYPPDPDPDPHEDFCPDPDPDPDPDPQKKKCGSETLVYFNSSKMFIYIYLRKFEKN